MVDEALTQPPTDVLVVGAGPVGLVAAVDLARRGVAVRIIDKLPEPTDESRAVVLHARSLELLDQLGVLDEIAATGVRTTGAQMHANGSILGRVGFDTIDSPFPYSITIPQTDTERILRERLSSLGVEIERGVTYTGLEQDASEVRANLTHPDRTTEVARVEWLVGSDGAKGAVRHSLGLKLEGVFQGERFLMGDVDADFAHEKQSFHIFFSPGDAVGMLFPMAGKRVRVICQIPAVTPETRDPTLEWLQESVDEREMDVRIESSRWLTIFEIHHAQVPRYRTGRAFLAGDAAHVHSPAGGLGMNTGIQDAFNLTWKLASALQGEPSEELLDSYHDERHPVAADVIKFTTELTHAGTLNSPFAREARDLLMKAGLELTLARHSMANEIEQMTVEYRYAPLGETGHRGPVRAGDPVRAVAEVGLWQALAQRDPSGSGYALVLVADEAGGFLNQAVPAGAQTIRVAPTTDGGALADPERRVAARYGLDERGGAILVRPDGYIAAISDAEHPTDIDAYTAAYIASVSAAPSEAFR
jgi:2-polyprenyl-6-methoxyphenol hydroxylase-like FAD-dependent oxidoreductase